MLNKTNWRYPAGPEWVWVLLMHTFWSLYNPDLQIEKGSFESYRHCLDVKDDLRERKLLWKETFVYACLVMTFAYLCIWSWVSSWLPYERVGPSLQHRRWRKQRDFLRQFKNSMDKYTVTSAGFYQAVELNLATPSSILCANFSDSSFHTVLRSP